MLPVAVGFVFDTGMFAAGKIDALAYVTYLDCFIHSVVG